MLILMWKNIRDEWGHSSEVRAFLSALRTAVFGEQPDHSSTFFPLYLQSSAHFDIISALTESNAVSAGYNTPSPAQNNVNDYVSSQWQARPIRGRPTLSFFFLNITPNLPRFDIRKVITSNVTFSGWWCLVPFSTPLIHNHSSYTPGSVPYACMSPCRRRGRQQFRILKRREKCTCNVSPPRSTFHLRNNRFCPLLGVLNWN